MHFSTWSPSYPCKTGHYWHKTDNSMPGQLVGDILRENLEIETSLVHRVLDKIFEMNVSVDLCFVHHRIERNHIKNVACSSRPGQISGP